MKKAQKTFTFREKIILQAMIAHHIESAERIEEYGMTPGATSEELKAIYKKVAELEEEEE